MSQVRIEYPADVFAAQQLARRMAREAGFSATAVAELMIVASELSSNILKYGKRGVLHVEHVKHLERGTGVRLTAEDEGPPFKSFETALLDGFNDDGPLDPLSLIARKGTASGLGAVRRLTHELTWEPLPAGKRVTAVRYLLGKRRR